MDHGLRDAKIPNEPKESTIVSHKTRRLERLDFNPLSILKSTNNEQDHFWLWNGHTTAQQSSHLSPIFYSYSLFFSLSYSLTLTKLYWHFWTNRLLLSVHYSRIWIEPYWSRILTIVIRIPSDPGKSCIDSFYSRHDQFAYKRTSQKFGLVSTPLAYL